MSPRLDALGIGITTRDRWDDLEVTLSELRNKGYENAETIVVDDGSEQPLPPALKATFPKVRFERVERSLGLVVQRNRLAKILSSPYYLTLNHTPFPVPGNICYAAIW